MIRKAYEQDIAEINETYDMVHTEIEAGNLMTGWKRGIYPTIKTVEDAVQRKDMFIEIENGVIVAAGIINQQQAAEYAACQWNYPASDHEIMVLHTLAVSPKAHGHGYAKMFINYYEEYAKQAGCRFLRLDTQVMNTAARHLYTRLGYQEVGMVEGTFYGIPNVKLVCFEKALKHD